MIISWKHEGLRKFFATGNKAGIIPSHEKRLKIILQRLNAATKLEDMNTPSMRLHSLSGKLKGHYAVVVNANWRVTFRFHGKDIIEVNYLDYH